jgi:protoporphyrinogen/coproporphyrinogen III oxidase
MKDVVILGAGITGLTVAHHLKKRGLNFILLEKADRVGGVINTVAEKGYIYEQGPNSGVVGNVEVIRLFEDLKGECELEEANENVHKRYILKNGKWEALPSGPLSAIKTPLFTLKDKFRILGEPFRPAGKNPNETLAGMVVRRLGKSFLDYAIDPFILGVYAGDPNKLIPRFALPKLYNLEQKYGSFIGGSIKKGREPKTAEEKKVTRSVFSVKGGLSSLINALNVRIGNHNILNGISNLTVEPDDQHFVVSFIDNSGMPVKLETRNVISTIGAYELDKVMPFIGHKSLTKITSLHYARVIEVVLGFNQWQGMKLDAFGGLIPYKENRDILGILFMSALFENRAPKEGALFSVFLGGVRNPEICELPDPEIEDILKKEICSLMKLDEYNPDLLKILRHNWAIPQYELDSEDRYKAVEEIENKYPGLIIGGNLRNGIGMADRIMQARMLADAIMTND